MKIVENEAVAIIDYYKSLKHGGYSFLGDRRETKVSLRDMILDATGWSMTTFYYKMRKRNFTKTEIAVIKPIIESHASEH